LSERERLHAAIKRIFTATLIIGVPGGGKTTLLASFAEYLWETHRKVLLLYSWDGGAIPTKVQLRMKQGLIRFWRVRTRSAEGLGIETVYLATKGYWPSKINPDTGETSPAVPMIAPVRLSYQVSCPQGHVLQTVPSASLINTQFCPTCKSMIEQNQLRIKEDAARAKGFENVGGVGFDGLTSMANVVMEHMDHARGAGQIGGEKPAFGGVVTSGVIKLGGNNRADVGFGQSRAQQFVSNSLSIPHLVEGPVFTALAMEATDEGGLAIVGAKLPGRAATDEASSWFGNVMEMNKLTDDGGKSHFALHLRPFTDDQKRRHLLKTSSSPLGVKSAVPAVLVDPPEGEGEACSVANLGDVFKLLDEDLRSALAEPVTGDLPDAAPAEYGEPATVEAAPAVVAGPVQAPAVPRPVGAPMAVGVPVGAVQPVGIAKPVPAQPVPMSGKPPMKAPGSST